MEHKTLETTFKHSLREKQSELDPSWYKAQGQKKKKSKRNAIFAYKANDRCLYSWLKLVIKTEKNPKIPIQLFQINSVTSAVSNHFYSLFESLEAKLSGSFCQQTS